jgi:hypothetical protein
MVRQQDGTWRSDSGNSRRTGYLLAGLLSCGLLAAAALAGVAVAGTSGSLDTSFGTGGTLTTSFNGDDGAGALLVQPDGKIVAAGSSDDNSTGHIFIALARYNP